VFRTLHERRHPQQSLTRMPPMHQLIGELSGNAPLAIDRSSQNHPFSYSVKKVKLVVLFNTLK
jgi:hypothetical protein